MKFRVGEGDKGVWHSHGHLGSPCEASFMVPALSQENFTEARANTTAEAKLVHLLKVPRIVFPLWRQGKIMVIRSKPLTIPIFYCILLYKRFLCQSWKSLYCVISRLSRILHNRILHWPVRHRRGGAQAKSSQTQPFVTNTVPILRPISPGPRG